MTRRNIPVLLCLIALATAFAVVGAAQSATEAPAAFATPLNNDGAGAVGNGFTDAATFQADTAKFLAVEDIPQGIGPIYNARSCGDCHATPNVAGTNQQAKLRVGHED